jgi:LmbE family N-acetylglucosaminyl deacetylase
MLNQVYVAPHSDDVALSCGGSVALAARTGIPAIVTVFAGRPVNAMTDFARFQHERWHLDDDEVFERRRSEDRCAAGALGASVQTEWLGYLDAIYRDEAYSSDDALFGSMVASDLALIDRITKSIEAMNAREYVVPIGIGNHVDHQIAFAVGRRLAARGCDVWAYADVPYVLTEHTVRHAEAASSAGDARLVYLDDDAVERKWRAIECYGSQLPVIFRGLDDPRHAVDRYARNLGGGQPAEAQWRVHPIRTSCSPNIGQR